MRIGVAGVGRVGAMHAANLAALPEVDKVVLFDAAAGRAADVAARLRLGGAAVDRFDDLLAVSDGVVIATPTSTHPELVRRCLRARVPVLCEKPVAGDLAELRDLVAAAEASGVPVLVGFQRRFDPAILELRDRIRAGLVGTVYQVRATGNDAQPPDLSYLPGSGGIFHDLLIHDLDAVPWLVGQQVVEVYASGSVLVDQGFAAVDDMDNAVAVLRFAGGAHAVLTAGRHDPRGYDHRIEVLGSRDSLAVGLDSRTPVASLEPDGLAVSPNAYRGFADRFHRAYVHEMAVFAEVVGGQADNPSPVGDSVASLVLANACAQSRRAGTPVHLPEPVGGPW